MKNKSLVVLSLAVLVAIFIGGSYFYKSNESSKVESLAVKNKNSAPFIREHSKTFGENAKNILVVEYIDPLCGACAFFYPKIKQVYKENYEDIKLVIRYLSANKYSIYTVKVLESASLQNMYDEVLNKLFSTQNKWLLNGEFKTGLFWAELEKIESLDINKLKKDVETIDVSNIIKLDRQDAQTLNVRSTPSVFVNGKRLNKLSYDELSNMVENEIYK